MALPLQSQLQLVCSFTATNVGRRVLLLCPTQPSLRIRIRSEKASSSEPSSLEDTSPSPSPSPSPPKKPGVGFGSSNSTATTATTSSSKNKQKKGRRERASIIRRTPVEKPPFADDQEKGKAKEETKNESAFLLAWLGFGVVILVEGISLAASGFLPEEWDKLFVKYLYPSFTPTVFLFVAGAVAYGVYKYLQNEKITEQK